MTWLPFASRPCRNRQNKNIWVWAIFGLMLLINKKYVTAELRPAVECLRTLESSTKPYLCTTQSSTELACSVTELSNDPLFGIKYSVVVE